MLRAVAGVNQSAAISSELRPVSAEIILRYCQASITDKTADVCLEEIKSTLRV